MEHILLLTEAEKRIVKYMLAGLSSTPKYKELEVVVRLCESISNSLEEEIPKDLKAALQEFYAVKSLTSKIENL